MRKDLEALLARARNVFPTPAQIREHQRSFAFGNAAIENPAVTREMVDRAAAKRRRRST
jgi:hypothetical protein